MIRSSLILALCLAAQACSGPKPAESADPTPPAPRSAEPAPPATADPAPAASDTPAPAASASATSPSSSAGPTAGVPAPKWTGIGGVSDCVGQILSAYACTPPKKPAKCGEPAWKELTALTGKDALVPCALEPDLLKCTVPVNGEPTSRCFAAKRPAGCDDAKWARVKDVKLVSACQSE